MLVKEFEYHLAWTDVVRNGRSYVGLIEYQRKLARTSSRSWVQVLWVYNANAMDAQKAEQAAVAMLSQIHEITRAGQVIYKDGVAL